LQIKPFHRERKNNNLKTKIQTHHTNKQHTNYARTNTHTHARINMRTHASKHARRHTHTYAYTIRDGQLIRVALNTFSRVL